MPCSVPTHTSHLHNTIAWPTSLNKTDTPITITIYGCETLCGLCGKTFGYGHSQLKKHVQRSCAKETFGEQVGRVTVKAGGRASDEPNGLVNQQMTKGEDEGDKGDEKVGTVEGHEKSDRIGGKRVNQKEVSTNREHPDSQDDNLLMMDHSEHEPADKVTEACIRENGSLHGRQDSGHRRFDQFGGTILDRPAERKAIQNFIAAVKATKETTEACITIEDAIAKNAIEANVLGAAGIRDRRTAVLEAAATKQDLEEFSSTSSCYSKASEVCRFCEEDAVLEFTGTGTMEFAFTGVGEHHPQCSRINNSEIERVHAVPQSASIPSLIAPLPQPGLSIYTPNGHQDSAPVERSSTPPQVNTNASRSTSYSSTNCTKHQDVSLAPHLDENASRSSWYIPSNTTDNQDSSMIGNVSAQTLEDPNAATRTWYISPNRDVSPLPDALNLTITYHTDRATRLSINGAPVTPLPSFYTAVYGPIYELSAEPRPFTPEPAPDAKRTALLTLASSHAETATLYTTLRTYVDHIFTSDYPYSASTIHAAQRLREQFEKKESKHERRAAKARRRAEERERKVAERERKEAVSGMGRLVPCKASEEHYFFSGSF